MVEKKVKNEDKGLIIATMDSENHYSDNYEN